MDRILRWIAWQMPRRLVYWCGVRMVTYASTKLRYREVPAFYANEILRIWDTVPRPLRFTKEEEWG